MTRFALRLNHRLIYNLKMVWSSFSNQSPSFPLTFSLQADAGLPAGWEVRHSNSKNLPYFFNGASKESRWEPPEGTDVEKLKVYMAQNTRKPEGKIRAAHLLVKHKDSRRPSSWKEQNITRAKEEAIDILKGHEARIRSGETSLGDLAQTESDCSSAKKRGDLSVDTACGSRQRD